jgi:hypothetical protein
VDEVQGYPRPDLCRDQGVHCTTIPQGKFLLTSYQYTNSPTIRDPDVAQKIQFFGNSLKSLHVNIEASLERLGTPYIDLFYVHWWDFTTSIPELMQGLHGLVLSRKVLYLVRTCSGNFGHAIKVSSGNFRRPSMGGDQG